jgi:hypothetical protein
VRPELDVLFLALALETIAQTGDSNAGEAFVDFAELFGGSLAGGRLGFEFVDSAEDRGALDLSVHVP